VDLPGTGLEPWNGVRWVAVSGSPNATHAVDVTSTLDKGVDSLLAHRAYLDGLGSSQMADAGTFLRENATRNADRFGGKLAVAFELIPF
jgi:hypothetical protein